MRNRTKKLLVVIALLGVAVFLFSGAKVKNSTIPQEAETTTEQRKLTAHVSNEEGVIDTFDKEFVNGDVLQMEFSVNDNEHNLVLYSLDDGKKYKVEVIPTDNGEFLGINFPEGQILFDNNLNAELKINTALIKEYPYNIELDYQENKILINIE